MGFIINDYFIFNIDIVVYNIFAEVKNLTRYECFLIIMVIIEFNTLITVFKLFIKEFKVLVFIKVRFNVGR